MLVRIFVDFDARNAHVSVHCPNTFEEIERSGDRAGAIALRRFMGSDGREVLERAASMAISPEKGPVELRARLASLAHRLNAETGSELVVMRPEIVDSDPLLEVRR